MYRVIWVIYIAITMYEHCERLQCHGVDYVSRVLTVTLFITTHTAENK